MVVLIYYLSYIYSEFRLRRLSSTRGAKGFWVKADISAQGRAKERAKRAKARSARASARRRLPQKLLLLTRRLLFMGFMMVRRMFKGCKPRIDLFGVGM